MYVVTPTKQPLKFSIDLLKNILKRNHSLNYLFANYSLLLHIFICEFQRDFITIKKEQLRTLHILQLKYCLVVTR